MLVRDELLVASRLLGFGGARPELLGLFGGLWLGNWLQGVLLGVRHQSLKGSVGVGVFSAGLWPDGLGARRTTTSLCILARSKRLDHLLLDVLRLLGLLFVLRLGLVVDVLQLVRLLVFLFLSILLMLLKCLLLHHEDLLDLLVC